MPLIGRLTDDRIVTRFSIVFTLLGQLLVLNACGTIMLGSTQQIGVSSVPTGARITVNGSRRGVTPIVLDLRRKDRQIISVTMDGYAAYEVALIRSVSGWVWGNIVFGGIIGLAVDASTGGLYKLSPEQITAELQAGDLVVDESGEVLVLSVVLRPEEGWERVGTLVGARR